MTIRLVEIPADWQDGGDFTISFDGVALDVRFGEKDDIAVALRFEWVRSFRCIAEGTLDGASYRIDPNAPLLSERPLPDLQNPAGDYYEAVHPGLKGSARLFRVYHYKAGLIEVVASTWLRI